MESPIINSLKEFEKRNNLSVALELHSDGSSALSDFWNSEETIKEFNTLEDLKSYLDNTSYKLSPAGRCYNPLQEVDEEEILQEDQSEDEYKQRIINKAEEFNTAMLEKIKMISILEERKERVLIEWTDLRMLKNDELMKLIIYSDIQKLVTVIVSGKKNVGSIFAPIWKDAIGMVSAIKIVQTRGKVSFRYRVNQIKADGKISKRKINKDRYDFERSDLQLIAS